MTDDNTSTADTTAAGEAPAAPPRRRRATRVTAAPSTDAPLESVVTVPSPAEQPVPVEQQAPAEQPVAEAPAAPVKKSRRVTRTVVPVAADQAPAAPVAPADEPAAQQQPVAEPAAEEPAAEAPVAPKKKSRRVTRTVVPVAADEAAAAQEPVAAQPAAEQPAAQQPAADEPATTAPRRRRSGTRAAAAPQAPAPTPEVEVEVEEAAEPTPALDVLAELAATVTPTEPSTTTSSTSTGRRFATTALLFQAPDPAAARPRRRRAQASTGSPEEISEAARRAEQEAAEAEARGSDEVAEVVEEAAPSARGRRRGRRGRGAETAPAEDLVVEEDAEPTAQAPADESVDDQVESDEDDSEQAEDDTAGGGPRRRRRRGGRGRRSRPDSADSDDADESDEDTDEGAESDTEPDADADDSTGEGDSSSRRRRRRRRGSSRGDSGDQGEARPARTRAPSDEVTALRGSTRLEAKRQRRRDGRDAGRRRQIITESEFLARRESVDRAMIVREKNNRTQIAVLEDGVLVEHYVSNQAQASTVGNVYLGRVQNVLPSMEAAFVDVGKGRNAVLYAGEVNWDAAGLEGGSARRIEQALKSGDPVLVQVTKDPIGHKGARLTSQVTLAGRYLVYVPGGGMTGISRKLPDTERNRLKKILREIVPDSAGVIVRTAAEGASEDELRADIARLQGQWAAIEKKSKSASAPALLQGEPDMAIRVVRDIFNDDFSSLVVAGAEAWSTISSYIDELAPDLAQKVSRWESDADVFAAHRIDEQLAKGMDRKVWLPSGGSLVIDRTEAMTVVDVNTGKFTGSGGTLEETVTRNNLEAAEEIVRQLRLRDIGGIIVIDFIDMVLESNRDLVLRRLVECLGRDRTKHQVAEVTSLGLVQMTRKRVGQGLVEAFSETCEHCHGRGFIVHEDPIEKNNQRPDAGAPQQPVASEGDAKRSRRKRGGAKETVAHVLHAGVPVLPEAREAVKATLATIAAAAAHAHDHDPQVPAAPEVDGDAAAEETKAPGLDVLAELSAGRAQAEPDAGGGAATPSDELELTAVPADVFEADDVDEVDDDSDASWVGGADRTQD
ncbi:Rne/Rng family ribonuclease [Cellulomonas fengjieae]|uniref:Ribonuclease E/G n=1 Tax=Cellulomonas fengjieae TaxID=2819978 RepID=A0ABS3SDV6_9CELL|nr:Rne/Rng family ribonuclease [Cellulomonas fengjieae]MBO3083933.1 ribonuclease E/G [Cellulomonas fengjieae]QVI64792.1 ribonuclease E/G [Cellulomonas fengjieae]